MAAYTDPDTVYAIFPISPYSVGMSSVLQYWLRMMAIALFGALVLLVLPSPAIAQARLAGRALSVCVKRVMPGDRPAAMFARRSTFDCTTPQVALGRGDFWVLASKLPPQANAAAPFAVRNIALWQQKNTLYGRYADGRIASHVVSTREVARHLQLGAIVEHRLPGRSVPLTELLWRIDGAENIRGILVGPRIASIEESIGANLFMASVYAAFGGLCLALLVHNLALWSVLKHNFQIAYCVMIATLLIYAISSSGALDWFVPSMPDVDRLRINYLALGCSANAALWFARTYFEPRVFSRPLIIASGAVSAALIGSALLFALLAPWHIGTLHRVFSFSFLGIVGIVPPVLWRAWRMQSNFLWVFAISWAAPILFAAIRTANSLNLIEWNFWVDNSTILAMSTEALLSSLAITYRIRLLSRERDEARVQELAARALADLDPLTGLLNRRSFLARTIGRTGEHVLMIADLDHFKLVNDTIGHDGGDEVLRVFARALRASLPPDALIARIGGEEFAIVTPAGREVDPERILARLRSERMPFDLTVTASIGASRGALMTEIDWKTLYRRADRALFSAKAEGRDRARHDFALAA